MLQECSRAWSLESRILKTSPAFQHFTFSFSGFLLFDVKQLSVPVVHGQVGDTRWSSHCGVLGADGTLAWIVLPSCLCLSSLMYKNRTAVEMILSIWCCTLCGYFLWISSSLLFHLCSVASNKMPCAMLLRESLLFPQWCRTARNDMKRACESFREFFQAKKEIEDSWTRNKVHGCDSWCIVIE